MSVPAAATLRAALRALAVLRQRVGQLHPAALWRLVVLVPRAGLPLQAVQERPEAQRQVVVLRALAGRVERP